MEFNIIDKYEYTRPYFENGDIILFNNNIVLNNILGNPYYTKIGIVKKDADRLFILYSHNNKIKQLLLSDKILSYKNGDFCLIKVNIPSKLKKTSIDSCTNLIGSTTKEFIKKYLNLLNLNKYSTYNLFNPEKLCIFTNSILSVEFNENQSICQNNQLELQKKLY